MATPLLSIGIIFKNEIRCLERCLKSLKPLRDAIPCELVMADTGATDGSREVAEKYADILIDFPWIDDFAAARNATMEKSSGKWFMFIDCDEWLDEDISGLIDFVTTDESFIFGAVNIRNYHTPELDKDDDYADFNGCRLLRMSSGLKFIGKIHEHWPADSNGEQHIMLVPNALFHHDGYLYLDPEVKQKKSDRNMTLLLERLKENPEDLATLMQCIESADGRPECRDYVQRAVAGVEAHHNGWKTVGAPILRYSVIGAYRSDNYETVVEDIARAERMFPDSMYTRLDVQFVAFGYSWRKSDYKECIRRGKLYLKAWADYEAGRYNHMDLVCSTLSTGSANFKTQIVIFLAAAYLYEKQPEKCLEILSQADGGRMTLKHVDDTVRTCAHLHARSRLDTRSIIVNLWEGINRPTPSEERARQRKNEFIRLASQLFLPAYRADEEGREDFCRHSYTLFLPLRGKCVLGNAAAMLEENDPAALAALLAETDEWNLLPTSALSHALCCGVPFPLPGRPMKLEELDNLAGRLAQEREDLHQLAVQSAKNAPQTMQELTWARSLALADIQTANWKDAEQTDRNMEAVRAFTQAERSFLPHYYAPGMLRAENIKLLPPLHRFGWYCGQAFDALDAGDAAGYVRLLREGLSVCESAKDMAEFLVEHTPKLQGQLEPSEELRALADQIRAALAQFDPDDPAVAALKQSEAYQKVAYLIEGMDVPVVGGLKQ